MAPQDIPSQLSHSRYGYDYVVATTQESINGAMMAFLSELTEPITTACYIADDDDGSPFFIDYNTLMTEAHGTDPFSIAADVDPDTDTDVQNLHKARFMFGFQAQLGLPGVPDPTLLPDLVTLGSNTSSVLFNLLCATFTVVQYIPKSDYIPHAKWLNVSQDSSDPWVFTAKVDLNLSTVDQSAYSKLPPDVQRKIKNLGEDAFSVQQLLFDLTNAGLMSVPKMSPNIKEGTPLHTVLSQSFLDIYFTQMQRDGAPLLGCSVVMKDAPLSTLSPTDLNLMVNPFMDGGEQPGDPTEEQQQLATLNYLCSIANHPLPPAVHFSWNWVDAVGHTDHDGVISINRAVFIEHIRAQLDPIMSSRCIATDCSVHYNSGEVDWAWSLTPDQRPTVTAGSSDSQVLVYTYSDESKDSCNRGEVKFSTTFNASVEYSGNTIVVNQSLKLTVYLRKTDHWNATSNVIDKSITDTYTLLINGFGALQPKLVSEPKDCSSDIVTAFGDFGQVQQLLHDVQNVVVGYVGTNMVIPTSDILDFIFPGGKTFIFKQVGFSPFQDLVSFITYAEPSASKAFAKAPALPMHETGFGPVVPMRTKDKKGASGTGKV